MKNKKLLFKYSIDSIMVVIGTFLMGVAFNVFLNANQISPSGFSGLSAIISNVLASNLGIYIPAAVFYLSINAVLFIFAFKNLGLRFAINSAIGILSYSLFMEFCKFNIGLSGNDLLLCAIYGGLIMGIGLGLVFKGHGSTGGSDMLANLLSKRFKFLTVGRLVLIVDLFVLVFSFIAYGDLNLTLYSLIAIYIMTKMSDVIVSGVQSLRAYYIVTLQSEDIAQKIMTEVQRGVTGFKSFGMYTHNDQTVLMTVVTRAESVKLRQIVADIDRSAFMYSCPISEAMGTGFVPLNKESKKRKMEKQEIIEQTLIAENAQTENIQEVKIESLSEQPKKTTKNKTKKSQKI